MESKPYSVKEEFLELAGFGRMYVKQYVPSLARNRTPVLCIPGFWRNSSDYRRLAGNIAGDRHVITPDLRGRGKSSRTNDVADYHFDKLIGDMWDLLDRLQVENVVIAGVALGGFMAIEMATQKPARVAGIVLNDVGTQTSSPGTKHIATHLSFDAIGFDEALGKTKKQYGDYFPDFDEDDWRSFTLQTYRQVAGDKYVRDFDELTQQETQRFKEAKPSFDKEFKALKLPVAILRAEKSLYMPADLALEMAGVNPNAQLTVVPVRGHPLLMDEPASLAAISAVLEEADRSRT
ncbi:alpha/beta hydrolase [Mesorhizobium sp. B2-4-15]|uniref:alpha/beta fold hydrolase n=1 Tax=Mesorhizobium sp. B2-4-15 TaxID=2589934 RepID=UPI00114D99A0|nr:alpha/beta hydrolase [Mesorhizobium sp. B2-4-15]TPK60916.1 alpha/beta hydrolase [Mesorhizobium sp. B2-4-15]